MNNLRPVKVWKEDTCTELDYTGFFHRFTKDCDGDCCAVIELEDGTLKEEMIKHVQFTDREDSK